MAASHIPSHHPAPLNVITDAQACRNAWRDAAFREHDLSPFQHPVFQEGLELILPWHRVVLETPGIGSASVFIRSRGPIRDLVLPPFSPFSAFLPAKQATDDDAGFFQASPDLPPTRLFSLPPGFEASSLGTLPDRADVQQRFTYHVQTAPLERAVEQWSSSQRRTFRKHADEYTVTVEEQQSLRDQPARVRKAIQDVTNLTAAGYERHGKRLPLEKNGLTRLAEEMIRSGLGRLLTLRRNGTETLEAGVLTLHHAPMAWYWLAGSVPGPAMTVMMAHLQDHLSAIGVPVLDLMGANTPGIAEFKRRFGGQKVGYLHVRTASLAGNLAEHGARLFHRLLP